MSIGALLFLAAQAAVPLAHAAPAGEPRASSATATVRIIRPAHFRADRLEATVAADPATAQLRTDAQGTRWVDFS